MGKRLSVVVLLFLLGASAMAAGDFWEERPYTTWTMAEIRTAISRSPWAQQVQVGEPPSTYDWGGGSRPEGPGANPGIAPQSEAGGPEVPATGEVPRVGARGDDITTASPSGVDPRSGIFFLIWSSAKTVRRALAQQQVLSGLATPEDAEEALRQPTPHHTITVAGPDLRAFQNYTTEELKGISYLKPNSRKEKVAPVEVQVFRHAERGTINSVTFSFARELASGEPLIPYTEKKVEFVCQLKRMKIKAQFEPKRMKLGEEPDL